MLRKFTFLLPLLALTICANFQLFAHNLPTQKPILPPVLQLVLDTKSDLTYLSEGCNNTDANFTFVLSQLASQPITFIVEFSGTATKDLDYTTTIPDTVRFATGQLTEQYQIKILADAVADDNENIHIKIRSTDGVYNDSVDINVYETLHLDFNPADIIYNCNGEGVPIKVSGAQSYSWTPTSWLNRSTGDSVRLITRDTGYIYVTGSFQGCIITDSVLVKHFSPEVQLIADSKKLCGADSVQLTAIPNIQGGTYIWAPAGLFSNHQSTVQDLFLDRSTIITVTYNYDGCVTSDSLHLTVVQGLEYEQPFTDTLVCNDQTINLGDFTQAPNYQFSPSTDIDFRDPDHPVIRPKASRNYELIITGQDTSCKKIYHFDIKVEDVTFKLESADSVNLCLDDSTRIQFNVDPSNVNVSWSPNDSTIRRESPGIFWVKPAVSTTYHFTATGPLGCTIDYNIKVRVDSMPEIPITNWNPKSKYCAGDSVLLTSPEVNKRKYPDITFNWTSIGEVNGTNDANLLIITQDTFLYIRRTVNVACMRNDSIKLNVVQPEILLNLQDSTVCADRPVTVMITNNITDIEWDPTTGVDCSNNCKTAVVRNGQSQQYKITGEKDGCPAVVFFNYNVRGVLSLNIKVTPEGQVAKGGEVILTITNPIPGVTEYEWKVNGRSIGTQGITVTVPVENQSNTYEVSVGPDPTGVHCGGYGVVNKEGIIPFINIPNAFTPNNDSQNDVFTAVAPEGVLVTNMVIVNRWGQKVFEANDNSGWDGKFNSKDAPSDTYLYRIRYRFSSGGDIEEKKGEINLLR